ncbi:serine/threonine kinase family protein [Plesiocystis pacifica SIR-1]|uniref:Serine/threonine kinase family protein n=1 Tax=Plesiocystis pacifica SIR-1 TaxID=391625 RepID=A6G212_9BACT|nr:protein kinase [Plesiocystis pacifica]EDM79981.1 serine/threonine kinase family protein [Plesiocystis pacifica SIR-1]
MEAEESFEAQMREAARVDAFEARQALGRIEEQLFARAPKPVTLGRYVLLDRCGAGSGGVVYRAYDPRLDRKVAIKLLEVRRARDRARDAAALREARAIARITHTNVVAVFDCGFYDEHDLAVEALDERLRGIPGRGVYVVMELIEGQDLREWMEERPRSSRAILEVFVAAGRGLAAAHEAGVVHRDFKPANVRVGLDGRVCVLDFGLAQLGRGRGRARKRRVVGTPLYMSPEQHAGSPITAASDQYSFGVALYEALTGARPFTGGVEAIAASKREGRWIGALGELLSAQQEAALRRCLALRPEERFPSMEAALAELERRSGALDWRARLAIVVGAGVLLLGGAVLGTVALERSQAREQALQCSGGATRAQTVWNLERREAVGARLRASGVSYAETTADAVTRELDDYVARWSAQHRDACEATRVRAEQSEAILDLRMACLDRHLREVGIVVDTLLESDTEVVENAVSAVGALGWLGACEDLDALGSRARLPRDPLARAEIEAGFGGLAEAKILVAAGRYDDGLTLASAVEDEAERLDHGPLRGAAALRRGEAMAGRGAFEGAEAALVDALVSAEAARDERLAAEAWLTLAWVRGVERHEPERGEVWLRLARAALDALGEDRRLEAIYLHNLGGLRSAQGDYRASIVEYERAVELQRALYGERDPAVAQTLNHIANAYMSLDEMGPAWTHAERSLALRRESLGEEHPLVAACYNNMALIRDAQGRHEEALELIRQALAIVVGTSTQREFVSRMIAAQIHEHRGDQAGRVEEYAAMIALPDELFPFFIERRELELEYAQLVEAASSSASSEAWRIEPSGASSSK